MAKAAFQKNIIAALKNGMQSPIAALRATAFYIFHASPVNGFWARTSPLAIRRFSKDGSAGVILPDFQFPRLTPFHVHILGYRSRNGNGVCGGGLP